jgi:NADPH:quinone reductase-like Zn-dependent oxidoreductase
VGAYAVQLTSQAKLEVAATAAAKDITYVQSVGASRVLVYRSTKLEDGVSGVDIVIDTVGGDTLELDRSIAAGRNPGGGRFTVSRNDGEEERSDRVLSCRCDDRRRFNKLTDLFEGHKLRTEAGSVLPLERARTAHEMLAGAPHKPGRLFWYRNKASRSWTNSLWP